MAYRDPEERRAKQRAYQRIHGHALYVAAQENRLAYQRAYRAAHHEEIRAYAAARYAASAVMSAARAAAAGANVTAKRAGTPGRLTPTDVLAVWAPGRCAYCGGNGIGLDHVIPLSRGGANTRANLVRCCRDCNGRKGRRTPGEWRATTHRGGSESGLPRSLRQATSTTEDTA